MNIFYKLEIRCLILMLLLMLVGISCQEDDKSVDQFLESLPHEHPQEITRFQQVDSIYFDHLGYTTIPRKDGTFLLHDRKQKILLQLDEQGDMVNRVARSGRGPGEVLDILSITGNGENGILLYDQGNNKIIEYDQQLDYKTEFSPEPYEGNSITDVYPAPDNKNYMLLHSSYAYLKDKTKQPQSFFTRYNIDSKTYEQAVTLQDRKYARLILDGEVRGGREVLFLPTQLIISNLEEQTLYTYWTGSDAIAEISSDFDTLRTVFVDLPSQAISKQTLDSLKGEFRSAQWNTLRDLLPEEKTPVEKMKVDAKNRFWLQLNYRGDTQMWLIIKEGEPQKIVHLPKGSILTHISGNHLGLRLNDITFALYEPVN